MSYQVNHYYNNLPFAIVNDGSLDTSSDLKLVGRNYPGYGVLQNDNFVYLLENFKGPSQPAKPIPGQIWYDSQNNRLRYYDVNNNFKATGTEIGTTQPSPVSSSVGDLWWNTTVGQEGLYAYDGHSYTLVGPPVGTAALAVELINVLDSGQISHSVIGMSVNDTTMAIVSDASFAVLQTTGNSIDGFSSIQAGITLKNVDVNGISSINGPYFWGTATDSLRLGGIDASEYLLGSNLSFNNLVHFGDQGYTLGNSTNDSAELQVYIDTTNNNAVTFKNKYSTNSEFVFTTTSSQSGITTNPVVLSISTVGLLPGATNQFYLGNSTSQWNDVYSNNLHSSTIYATNILPFPAPNTTPLSITGIVTGSLIGNPTPNSGSIPIVQYSPSSGSLITLINSDGLIGNINASLAGTLTGNVVGTATNAIALNNLSGVVDPSGTVSNSTGSSVAIRDNNGYLYAANFVGVATLSNKTFIVQQNATPPVPDPTWSNSVGATQYRSATIDPTPWSIAARDSSGNIAANLFNGIATSARYADLAEKYIPDTEYNVGTVVSVGGVAEITECTAGDFAIGVISENPAFKMNSELKGGIYVALKGRVNVKVQGYINKGDKLVACYAGTASKQNHHSEHVFAIALESNLTTTATSIEALIL
jgi:hypothetical protein